MARRKSWSLIGRPKLSAADAKHSTGITLKSVYDGSGRNGPGNG
jgi:hypothetical protein